MLFELIIGPTSFPGAKFSDIRTVVNLLLPLVSALAAVALLFLILSAAFQWITSEGKPENLAKAQKTFIFAAIGLLIVIISYFGVKLLATLLNISLPL